MAFKIEGKEMYPSLFLQCCFGQFTPKWKGLASMRTAKQRKATPTQPLQFHVKFMCMLC